MKNKKEIISIPLSKHRDFNLISAQLKGLLQTKVIKNKKKENKKFNYKKEMSYYLSVY